MSEFKRQHPAAAVEQLFTVVRKNLITFIILFFLGTRESENSIFLYILYGSLMLSFISGVLSWWLFRYRVTDNELQIRKGIIVRKNLYLSKDRIQVIDITEGIVQRIFGLVQLEVKTAGGGTETAAIHAISRWEAERLRAELRGHNHDHTAENNIQEWPQTGAGMEVTDVWQVPAKDLLAAAATSGSFGLIASLLGAVSGQLNLFVTDESIDYVTGRLPEASSTALIAVFIAGILIVSWVLSFLGVILKYYNFKVEKTDSELIVTSGLIERKHITVPYNRIQAVRFVEGVIRQPFRSGMLYVESAGFEVKQKERSITLLPYVTKQEMVGFFERFLPQYVISDPEVKPPPAARWRYLRRPNYILFILVPVLWWGFEFNLSVLVLIPFLIYYGWLQMRDSGLAIRGDMLTLYYRGLSRTTALISRKRIQTAATHSNPFQNWKSLTDLTITAASGAKGIDFRIRDLAGKDTAKILSWVVDENPSETEHELPIDY